jgi:hypothetical protein
MVCAGAGGTFQLPTRFRLVGGPSPRLVGWLSRLAGELLPLQRVDLVASRSQFNCHRPLQVTIWAGDSRVSVECVSTAFCAVLARLGTLDRAQSRFTLDSVIGIRDSEFGSQEFVT